MDADGDIQEQSAPKLGFGATVGLLFVAILWGAIAGAFMAWIAPSDKFSWAGIAVAPLWLILEAFLEGIAGSSSALSKELRVISILLVLGAFYVAWFCFRGT